MGATEPLINAKGHTWLIDCVLECTGYDYAIHSPYILFDNVTSDFNSDVKNFDTPHDISVTHCEISNNSNTRFTSTSIVVDDSEMPADFIYRLIYKNSQLKQIASRRKLYNFLPAKKADPYDYFKESTHYTNVDLHRRIDQNSTILKGIGTNYIPPYIIELICLGLYESSTFELTAISDEVIRAICNDTYEDDQHPHSWPVISNEVVEDIMRGRYIPEPNNGYEYDETDSRKYDLGIYSLNSYRTTELSFYDDNSILEFP